MFGKKSIKLLYTLKTGPKINRWQILSHFDLSKQMNAKKM